MNATIGLPTTASILVGMGIVVLYSTFGGAWAVIQTDMLQFVFLGVLLPLALVIGLVQVGGPAALVDAVPAGHLTALGAYSLPTFLSIFLAFLLGETLVPPYAQRTFSTPDSGNARLGFALAGMFSFGFFFVTASLGLVALAKFPGIAPDQALPTIARQLLPVGLVGLVVAALLAVVMSTASSYLNSMAVVFVKDIYLPFVNPSVSASRRLWLERALSLVVGAAATIIIPLLAAALFGTTSRPAALAAIVGGGVMTALWTWVWDEPLGITGLAAGVATNLVVFTAVALATRGRRGTAAPLAPVGTSEVS